MIYLQVFFNFVVDIVSVMSYSRVSRVCYLKSSDEFNELNEPRPVVLVRSTPNHFYKRNQIMATKRSKTSVLDITAFDTAITAVRSVPLKEGVPAMATSKFYTTAVVEKRAVECANLARLVYEFGRQFEALDDQDATDALRGAILRTAKELRCHAQRLQNIDVQGVLDAEKAAKVRARIAKDAKLLSKFEAKAGKTKKVEDEVK